MLHIKDILYLEWIFNRLVHRFKDDPKYVQAAKAILNKIKKPSIVISDCNLDKILSKYFIDFNLQKTETVGFDDKDREELRKSIRLIVSDILVNNIPKDNEILIK